MKTHLLRILALAPAVAALSLPVHAANETAARVESNVSELKGDAAKAALDELGVEIDRVDAQIDNAPTPEEKAAAKVRLQELKDRRNDLRKTYAKARYDQLKADVRAEAAHVAAWSKRTFTRDSSDKVRDDVRAAGDKTYAAAATAGTEMDLAAYKLRPTDTNKAEAKAALKALDQRIDELDDRADQMPRGADREAAKRRVKALEDQKDDLKHDFNKARFDALVDSVQAEWNDLRH